MLGKFREKAKVITYITAFVFIIGMAVMGISGMFGQKTPYVGKIAGKKITYQQYIGWLQNAYRSYTYENPDASVDEQTAKRLNDQTWQQIVQKIILDNEIKKRRIKVKDQDVIDRLRNDPPQFIKDAEIFQTDGSFDRNKYLNTLVNGVTEEGHVIDLSFLENSIREQLPYELLYDSIKNEVVVTEKEVKENYVGEHSKADAKIIFFNPYDITDVDATDEDLEAYYKEHQEEYRADPSARYDFVHFELKPSESDEKEVQDLINDIHDRIIKGEDFAALARQYSEDKSNSENGGALGYFGKGRMVKEFEEAAFGLDIGGVSKPVKTQFGYHIVKVTGKRTNDQKEPEVEASHILLSLSPSDETKRENYRKADEFYQLAKKKGFNKAIQSTEYTRNASGLFEEKSQYIPGIGRYDDLVKFAFKNRVNAIPELKEGTNGDFYVLVIAEKLPERYRSLDEVRGRVKAAVENKMKVDGALAKAKEFHKKYNKDNYLEMAKIEGIDVIEASDINANKAITQIGFSKLLNDAILNTKEGTFTELITEDRGAYIAFVEKKVEANLEQFESEKDALLEELREKRQNEHLNDWYQKAYEASKIEDNRSYFF